MKVTPSLSTGRPVGNCGGVDLPRIRIDTRVVSERDIPQGYYMCVLWKGVLYLIDAADAQEVQLKTVTFLKHLGLSTNEDIQGGFLQKYDGGFLVEDACGLAIPVINPIDIMYHSVVLCNEVLLN